MDRVTAEMIRRDPRVVGEFLAYIVQVEGRRRCHDPWQSGDECSASDRRSLRGAARLTMCPSGAGTRRGARTLRPLSLVSIASVVAAMLAVLLPAVASAHSITGRIDSPLPFVAYLAGAAIAVAGSFVIMAASDPGPPRDPSSRPGTDGATLAAPWTARGGAAGLALDRGTDPRGRIERCGCGVAVPVGLRLGRLGAAERIPGAGLVVDRPIHDHLRPHRGGRSAAGGVGSRGAALAGSPWLLDRGRWPGVLHLAGARGTCPPGPIAGTGAAGLHRDHAPGHGAVRARCVASRRPRPSASGSASSAGWRRSHCPARPRMGGSSSGPTRRVSSPAAGLARWS